MKRIALKLVMLLLLGAIINIAMAWGCIVRLPYIRGFEHKRTMSEDEAFALATQAGAEVSRDWMSTTYAVSQSRFGWTSWLVSTGPSVPDDLLIFVHVKGTSAGWPARSLTTYSVFDNRKPPDQRFVSKGAIALPAWVRPKQNASPMIFGDPASIPFESVPHIPIWPGFAINTILYAAILWMVFAFPGAWRRRRRIKRGLCPARAYPVGDSAVCTECGESHCAT